MTNSPYSGSEEDDYTDSDVSETERSSVVDDPPAKTQPRVPQLSLGTKVPQLPLGAKVPSLNIGSASAPNHVADNESSEQEARQQVRKSPPTPLLVPSLSGKIPGTGSPSQGGTPSYAASSTPTSTRSLKPEIGALLQNAQKAAETRSLGAQSAQTSSSGTTVAVDLVSSAFQVSITPGKADESSHEVMDSIRTRCVNGMGIVEDDLEFFEIKPLSDSEAASAVARGSHVGVRVKRSGFTLGGLEQLLEEHARLATNLDKCTAALEGMREESRAHSIAAATARTALAAEEAQVRQWCDSCHALETEVATLRQQLQRADGLRVHSQKALDELKNEFEALTKDITEDGLLTPVTRNAAEPFPLGQERATSGIFGRAVEDARAVAVVERLCSNEVLSQLERIINQVQAPEKNSKAGVGSNTDDFVS
ncbi:hypothetical protein CYMTET_47610 [Cymbomonas tetramitiformis]|uniref:Uncharacterized protein n=1 Tax=Cymbomonas tetramitiformis TaxID=36881 RepID=A0AAE0EVZ6_9CHLO|nr:hypothetical protein CYMTET_47610 [Cymbomonas tetramitiformis]